MTQQRWVGTDEWGGIPNPGRPDTKPAPNWRLEWVAATERPRQCEVSPDGSTVAFVRDRDTSAVWTMPVAGGIGFQPVADERGASRHRQPGCRYG